MIDLSQETFLERLDHFFDVSTSQFSRVHLLLRLVTQKGGYYLSGNEPSFQVGPLLCLARIVFADVTRLLLGTTMLTNLRGPLIASAVLSWTTSVSVSLLPRPPALDHTDHFRDPDVAGLPGNDDQAAMASLLTFHLLGLYPGKRPSSVSSQLLHYSLRHTPTTVPSSTHYLIISPFVPKYTIHNSYLNASTTVTVKNYDPKSVAYPIPKGVAAYVKSVTINGKPAASRCYIDFYDTFRSGGEIEIEVTSDKDEANSCGGPVPESLSTGGFAQAR
jgi:putative alpha-1,2-mannosidase